MTGGGKRKNAFSSLCSSYLKVLFNKFATFFYDYILQPDKYFCEILTTKFFYILSWKKIYLVSRSMKVFAI